MAWYGAVKFDSCTGVTNAADVEEVFEGGDVEGSLGGKTKDVGPPC